MDHFEGIVATLLRAEGYWVAPSYKVNLTKEEKRDIGKLSIPRPEIDLLALNFSQNKIFAIEAKSYLDSSGVPFAALQEVHEIPEGRYKLFTCDRYRKIVFKRMHQQLIENCMANQATTIELGLAAGNVHRQDQEQITDFMRQNNWHYWSPLDIKKRVQELASLGYENDAAIITAKILS